MPGERPASGPIRSSAWARLAPVDALALLAFVLVGVADHAGGRVPAMSVLRTGGPVLAAWFLLAPILGTYRRPGFLSLLSTWIVALPAGLVVRGLILGRSFGTGFLIFLAAALGFSILFLLAGRVLVALVGRARRRAVAAGPGPVRSS